MKKSALTVVDAYKTTAARLLANPDDPEQLANQYTLLSTTKSPASLPIAARCAAVAPDEFIAVFNYASARMRAGLDSLDQFKRALEIAPHDRQAITMHHIGLACHERGEFDVALRWYQLAMSADPNEPELAHSIAIAKLDQGHLREGLYEREVRGHVAPRKPISESGIPRWSGEDLTGKRVILAHEQGFGDTIQFIRFALRLRDVCGHLIFSGTDTLAKLIADQFDCFDDVINEEGPFEADFVTSPMAACALLGIEYRDVTGYAYMMAKPLALPARGRLKVGLAWQGLHGHRNDHLRSMALTDLFPLFDLPGAAFYSLQVEADAAPITQLGLDGFIADLGSTFSDWRSTAAAVAAMDVIVSVDTGTAHIAGALGKPVILLIGKQPDWRWMRGDTTPWYRNHKLLRKTDAWPMVEARRLLEGML